jgi:hypothetical protein
MQNYVASGNYVNDQTTKTKIDALMSSDKAKDFITDQLNDADLRAILIKFFTKTRSNPAMVSSIWQMDHAGLKGVFKTTIDNNTAKKHIEGSPNLKKAFLLENMQFIDDLLIKTIGEGKKKFGSMFGAIGDFFDTAAVLKIIYKMADDAKEHRNKDGNYSFTFGLLDALKEHFVEDGLISKLFPGKKNIQAADGHNISEAS